MSWFRIVAVMSVQTFFSACFAMMIENGIERDDEPVATSHHQHLLVTMWDLRDRTDGVGELVQKREWLLLPRTADIEVEGNVIDVQDVVSGVGTVYLRIAPLPGSRSWDGPDFRISASSPKGVVVIDRPCRTLTIPYEGGNVGRRTALIMAQRRIRPFKAGRDGVFLSNTWGDRNRDARLSESFVRAEITAAANLGVDVVQMDDGWQKGRTVNSSVAGSDGVWDGYWTKDPEFWKADPVRFPHGLGAIVRAARENGIGIGLWFGPDSSYDAKNWERDADLLLEYHQKYGINYFKIDSLKTDSPIALANQTSLFGKVLNESGGRVVFDLDVTAERRPGYFGLPEIGAIFVENRYTDWHKYWPHQTLRQFWSLADVVDPVRLRMEILNPLRHCELYAGDPLAPSEWPIESIFATVMLGSPLGWFEVSGLASSTIDRLAPFVTTWKRHRNRLHSGVVHPVGDKPDGVAWTGFVVRGDDGCDVILFRELNPYKEFELDITPYFSGGQVAVLSPRGTATVANGRLQVVVSDRLDFIWVRLDAVDSSCVF